MMGGKPMCGHCRSVKKKCVEDGHKRRWVEGEHERCPRCIELKLPCGPPESPPIRSSRRRSIRNSFSSQAGPERGVIPTEVGLEGLAGASAGLKSDAEALMERLLHLKEHLDSFETLQWSLDQMEVREGCFGPHWEDLDRVRNATRRELSSELSETESLADRVFKSGDIKAALYAYTRVLGVYRALGSKAWHEISGLLRKMVRISFDIGDELEAQSLLWQALELGDSPRHALDSDQHLLKEIARSTSRTSIRQARIIHSNIIPPVASNLQTPVPPLQKMMQSRYASDVLGNIFQAGPFPLAANSNSDGLKNVKDLLEEFDNDELVMRDVLGRSPLHLATSLRQERIVQGLISRVEQLGWSLADRLLNMRDLFGQTILECAISSDCSFHLIKTFIDKGAEVDPDSPPSWSPMMTPLQIAADKGLLDVVRLLIEGGADRTRGPMEQTPQDLARLGGHDEVVLLLNQEPEDPGMFSFIN